MTYREVGMLEVKEVMRLWLAAMPKKRIAETLGLDPKTVRRYIALATAQGLVPGPLGQVSLVEQAIESMLVALHGAGRPHGDGWERCAAHRLFIEQKLADLKLSKVRRLLLRQGIDVPYPTLRRFAMAELGYGRGRR